MGERHGDGGCPDRRVARPGNGWAKSDGSTAAGPRNAPTLESLLAAALRADTLDPDAENRALAAFRAARDAGTHEARTRRRDDWRPGAERWGGRSLWATLAGLLASVTLGGVAIAAIGSGATSGGGDDGGSGPQPSSSAPDRSPSDTASTAAPGSSVPGRGGGRPGRRSSVQDAEVHCRAFASVEKRGKALESAARRRLVDAAGGEGNVEEYCAGHTGPPTGNAGGADRAGDVPTTTDSRKGGVPAVTDNGGEAVKPSTAPGGGSKKDAAP